MTLEEFVSKLKENDHIKVGGGKCGSNKTGGANTGCC